MKDITIRRVDKGVVDGDKKHNFKRVQLSFDEPTNFSLNKICLGVVEEGNRPLDRSKMVRALIRYADSLSLLEIKALLKQFGD
ncbi:hypothetical protein [Plesiomonas sp. ZOR0011]|uniref:hypothetical protein n=1 Tax=Plesiomonas sp. ZOR0011 TaxID=1339230 RepID=UPI000648C074|nr:hypothetical protein [Plesiomonas sp. ZOR0011]